MDILNRTLIIKTRRHLRWTQQTLADKAGDGITQHYICKIESGACKHPSFNTIALIATALKIEIKDLILKIDRSTDVDFSE